MINRIPLTKAIDYFHSMPTIWRVTKNHDFVCLSASVTYDCAWFNRYLDLMLITFLIYNNTFLQIKEVTVFLVSPYAFKKVKDQLYVSRKYEEMKILSVLKKTAARIIQHRDKT